MNASNAAARPFVRAPAAGVTHNILGTTHVYKATAAETANVFSLWETIVPPGDGPPPHTHAREDEAFYVLSGEFVFELEGEPAPRRIGPGGFCFGARGRRHAFRNTGRDTGRLLVLVVPGSGLEQMFGELDAVTAATPDFAAITAICAKYGVTIEAPAG
jgi:quercetin dioxygenase-like cupin family protein